MDQSPQPRVRRGPITAWHPVFLAVLRASGNVRAACQAAGVDRPCAYRHRARLAGFRRQWDEALADAIDGLEAAAWERAKTVSDTLLIFLLKAHRPWLYRDTVNIEVYLRQQAASLGLDADAVIAEAQTMLREARTR